MSEPSRIAIVGNAGGTNVGQSLFRAAQRLDMPALFSDARRAASRSRALRAIGWRLLDRRPWHLRQFGEDVVAECRRHGDVHVLVATGHAPLDTACLSRLDSMGIRTVNFSTDDPWNRGLHAGWFLESLPRYHHVLTPRHANIDDLRKLGCADVRYLPFGYDDELFKPLADASTVCDVLFAGGADSERIGFMREFASPRFTLRLVGDYWHRDRITRALSIGHLDPRALAAATAGAKVNLCLVRRANRDGHVMRSFELAASGACMLVEDTEDHRDLFGADGDAVAYFSSPAQARARAIELLDDADRRSAMAVAVRHRIVHGRHAYTDRLRQILDCAGMR